MSAIAGLVAAVLLVLVISLYNRLVRARNSVENAFASIDVQLKQRCDLIPKLVDSMRAYMTHERGTLDEAYPDLKASETVTLLQRSLNEVEAQIAAARRTYNAAATGFNTAIEVFPANLLAGLFGFSRRPLFEASADDRAVPGIR
jgi:LemA protein